jgi:hypothetical protein
VTAPAGPLTKSPVGVDSTAICDASAGSKSGAAALDITTDAASLSSVA